MFICDVFYSRVFMISNKRRHLSRKIKLIVVVEIEMFVPIINTGIFNVSHSYEADEGYSNCVAPNGGTSKLNKTEWHNIFVLRRLHIWRANSLQSSRSRQTCKPTLKYVTDRTASRAVNHNEFVRSSNSNRSSEQCKKTLGTPMCSCLKDVIWINRYLWEEYAQLHIECAGQLACRRQFPLESHSPLLWTWTRELLDWRSDSMVARRSRSAIPWPRQRRTMSHWSPWLPPLPPDPIDVYCGTMFSIIIEFIIELIMNWIELIIIYIIKNWWKCNYNDTIINNILYLRIKIKLLLLLIIIINYNFVT